MNESTFAKEQCLALLRDVHDELPPGTTTRIQIGGGVAIMSIDPSRASSDIDLFMEEVPPAIERASAKVAEARHLDEGWINNIPAQLGLIPFDVEETPFFEGPRLIVEVIDPISMLLLKLHAGRDKDTEDIVLLMKHTGITSEEMLHSLIDEYAAEYPDAGIDIFWMKQNATEAAVAVREHFWGVGTPHGHDTAEPHGAAADVPFDIDNGS